MKNLVLLQKRRHKLSLYFASFLLLSFWILQWIFQSYSYITNNLRLEEKLNSKTSAVQNILDNAPLYLEKVASWDTSVEQLIQSSLRNTVVYSWSEFILWEENVLPSSFWFYDSESYKYKHSKHLEYWIITRVESMYTLHKVLTDFAYFVLFSIPFWVLFYYIWYRFVGHNLKPIKEVISSLEDFSGNINHELKTPLAEIISSLSLSKKITENREEAINQSLYSAKKMSKILDSILWIINLVDISYSDKKILLQKELEEIIKIHSSFAESKKIDVFLSVDNPEFEIKALPEHVEIVFWNILKNAIKYSPNLSKIDIFLENWVLRIKDYWIWIEEKNLKNIFSRYFRENYINEEGYGLWLSLVKKISDINSWDIKIESEKWKWTIVTINFN